MKTSAKNFGLAVGP